MRISGIIGFDHHRDTEDTEFMKGMFRIESKRRYAEQTIFCLLCVLCVPVVHIFAQDFRTVSPGVEYAQVKREFSGQTVSMNLLRLDLTKVRLDVVHANDRAIGTETVSSMAKRHGAFGAINGGFFRDDGSVWAGDAAGILKIDGHFLSEPEKDRTALYITNHTELTTSSFGKSRLILIVRYEKRKLYVDGINRQPADSQLVVFTPEFGRATSTSNDVTELVVSGNKMRGVYDGSGTNSIPDDGFVLSASGERRNDLMQFYKPRHRIALQFGDLDADSLVFWDETNFGHGFPPIGGSEDIIGGVPQLIKNGKVDITWEQEKTNLKFVETRHPRTAVAKLKDGKFLMITVDGRSETSGGISLFDLADYLLTLGATDAMNLDGGGSTTMYVDGKVVNHPSDPTGERKVSDAILVTLRKPAKKK